MSTQHAAINEVLRSQEMTTIFGNSGPNEESSQISPTLPGTALNWIDGEWVNANKTTDSFDPATGDRIPNR